MASRGFRAETIGKAPLRTAETSSGYQKRESALAFPDPSDPSRCVAWNGTAFDLGDEKVRVLAYDVSPSGWTDELTHLHEEAGGSEHFIDVASRNHACKEAERWLRRTPSVLLEIGVSSGFLLRELQSRLNEHTVIGPITHGGRLKRWGSGSPACRSSSSI
jgi:hypothetical protein